MSKLKLPIYMDAHATTPVDPRVLEAMLPTLTSEFGNPSSRIHAFGRRAEGLVDEARRQAAHLVGAEPKEIIFTSSTTESNNLALKGLFEIYREAKDHVITQVTEHKSVLECCKFLEKCGAKVTTLRVDSAGRISLEDLRKAITPRTLLISIMSANNEIGTLQPIRMIGKIAKEHGIFFHTDAAQAAGKIPISVQEMGIDLLSFSAHKMYGPKGAGALYVRSANPRVRLARQMHGGGHEEGLRSGTLNVPGIVGFGKACEIAEKETKAESLRVAGLRDRLKAGIEQALDDVHRNGHPTERLPGNLNLSFAHVDGEALLMGVNEEIAVSSGSACTTGSPEPSYVLKAIGLPEEKIHTSIRFGLGRFNTEEEVDYTIEKVAAVVKRLRKSSPIHSHSLKE